MTETYPVPIDTATVLAGRVVIITGAARGLGAAYARGIAQAGAAVVVNDIDGDEAESVARSIREAGGRAVAHPADITDWEAAAGLIDRAVAEFGRLDGLVNNAGFFDLALPQDEKESSIRRAVDVNLIGSSFCGVHALRHMVSVGSGAIVNVTSGQQMGGSATAIYGATKAAVAALTYSWAMDVAEHGVRVNAISPNAHTRMADRYAAFLGSGGTQNIGLAPEVNAPLVVYLLSDLSRQLNGQVVRMNGSELMLCTHPANLAPALRREVWDVPAIAEAFATDFADRLQPLGIQTVETRTVAP